MIIEFSKYYQPKPKQAEAHKCRAKYLLFGGAMGGGKSFWLCAEAINNAMKFEGNRLALVRKELSVARRTIVVSFFSICPPEIILSFNKSSLEITFINGSKLYVIEADIGKDPLLNKLKGLEIGWFGIDEANEVSKEVYDVLKTRMRWVLPNGSTPRYEGRLTSNPENCWLIPTFIDSTEREEVYIQSLTSDNYEEGSEYYQNLLQAFSDNPKMLARYLHGDWSLVDGIDQLIPSASIAMCEKPVCNGSGSSIGIDVARYGSDKTVFVVMIDGNIEQIDSYSQTSTQQIITKAIELIETFCIDSNNVGIDGVGVGAGVIDGLKSQGFDIKELIGGSKPIEPFYEEAFQANNLRSQMYYQLRQNIMDANIGKLSHK
ncbi:MAG: phage terminase large subunit, partial [Flavobacteriales bacterium]